MNPSLHRLIEASNPWLLDPGAWQRVLSTRIPTGFISREAAPDLEGALDRGVGRAHLVVGPRQAGKSTLVWSLAEQLAPAEMLFINCEEVLVREWCRSPTLFAADVRNWVADRGFLFFEEAQHLDEAGLFLKGLVDLQEPWRVVVTGSASFHLRARTRESLAGRATRHRLWPLSLVEITASRVQAGAVAAVRETLAERCVTEMLRFGGYPAVVTDPENRVAILDELLNAFVLRDASDRFRIERPDALRTLMQLASRQIGDLVRYAEWSSIAGISAHTVQEYCSVLEDAHIITRVRPFVGGRRAEVTKAPKIYFVDNGVRNAVGSGFAPLDAREDLGKLLENWVASELLKALPRPDDVRYWRSKNGAEVDFVVRDPEDPAVPLLAVEVKAGGSPGKISRSARSFVEAYAPKELWIVGGSELGVERTAATVVRRMPAGSFPTRLRELQRG